MTTILAYKDEENSYIATESQTTYGCEIGFNHYKKIIKKGKLYFAMEGDGLVINIMQDIWDLPKRKKLSKKHYIAKAVVPSFRKAIHDYVTSRGISPKVDFGMIIVYKSEIYRVFPGSAWRRIKKHEIISGGSGAYYAESYFNASSEKDIKKRLISSIEYAISKDIYSGGKIRVKVIPHKNKDTI